ncbi:MAG: hypothetical protein MZV63_06890 [Marinilabiliales bacterium]|nr:hypothetical protein [Marinilabiliales bacterium]
MRKITSTSIVTLDVDGTEYPALVREKQRDFIKNRLPACGLPCGIPDREASRHRGPAILWRFPRCEGFQCGVRSQP